MRTVRPVAQYAWALFDGARSPYNVLVNIFVFSAYFSSVVVPDPVRGQVLWSYTSSAAALLVALGAPVLGAIADAAGRRKPWLLGTMALGVPSMCLLWFATPAMTTDLYGIMAALVGGTLFFLLTPDSPPSANSIGDTVRHGLRALAQTVTKLGNFTNIALFLVTRMIFNEGFVVMMLFTGVFAATIMHWTPEMLITQGLLNSVAATLAGGAAGWIDQRIGSKRATMVFIAGAALANLLICSVIPDTVLFVPLPHPVAHSGGMFPTLPDQVFMVAEVAIAFFVTGGLATSRALMAKLTPPTMLNEFFGLYAMSGTATTFLGPAAIGALTHVFHNNRVGVAVGIVFLSSGFLLMFKVREES